MSVDQSGRRYTAAHPLVMFGVSGKAAFAALLYRSHEVRGGAKGRAEEKFVLWSEKFLFE